MRRYRDGSRHDLIPPDRTGHADFLRIARIKHQVDVRPNYRTRPPSRKNRCRTSIRADKTPVKPLYSSSTLVTLRLAGIASDVVGE